MLLSDVEDWQAQCHERNTRNGLSNTVGHALKGTSI